MIQMSPEDDSIHTAGKPRSEEITLVRPGERFGCPLFCPECSGPMEIVIDEWEHGTGRPIDGGFRLICLREENDSGVETFWGERHHYWQSVWQNSLRHALRWMIRAGIRVSKGNED